MAQTQRRLVLTNSPNPQAPRHGVETQQAIARWLADIQGLEYGGRYDHQQHAGRPCYLVPSRCVVGREQARQLNVQGPDDLFGGYVDHGFIATKAITHPLVAEDAVAPTGWVPGFAEQIAALVLKGFTVFSPQDAERAARTLLAAGPLRFKPVQASGGREQHVFRNLHDFQTFIGAPARAAQFVEGVVLEEELTDVSTHSVGQIRVGEHLLSYFGTQHLTEDAQGVQVYGGSDLLVVRGDYARLLQLDLAGQVRLAIEQARTFDAAVSEAFPSFFASRRNYDLIRGTDARGETRSAVLEQSWRLGGASSAEVGALQAFIDNPLLQVVRASSFEIFHDKVLPANAIEVFRGHDEELGFLIKYAMVEPYDGEN
jgi:hypothetical protein